MIVESTTIKVPAQVPSPAEDAEQLRNAFKRWSTNKQLIISILAHRNAAQRKLIRDAYAEAFGEDFLKSLEKKLSHDFERCVFLWTLTPPERDAHLAHDATTRSDSSNWVLMEIACTRSPDELSLVKEAYCALYKKSLKEDVAYRTKGDFRKLLVPLFGDRDERAEVNMTLAKSEGELLHEKISKKAYSDEEVIRILTTTSKAQLNATLNHYNDAFGNAINKNLKEDSNNKFLKLLMATIACLTRPEKYFEKVLGQAIKGVGTDERALTRVVTTRAEVDMQHIKEEYQKRNSIPLEKAIADDTSRYYKKMLLALVGHEEA